MPEAFFKDYARRSQEAISGADFNKIVGLAHALDRAWQEGRRVFLCGNGGSAANAMHLANDLALGTATQTRRGLKVQALTADASILTCLANDLSYEAVFSEQLLTLAEAEDVLIALSGSGNSPNILRALEAAQKIGMHSYAILGFSGGKSLQLASECIHFPIHDMQIAEDMQLVVGHMIMQWLRKNSADTQGTRR